MSATSFPVSYAVPAVEPATLLPFLREQFGLDGTLSPLPGERDRNFRLDEPDGSRYVVKVANALEERLVIELQHDALGRIAERAPGLGLPRVVPGRKGAGIVTLPVAGRPHFVRVLTWVEGVPLATVKPMTAHQLRTLGALLARIHDALDGFDHPGANRSLKWDLAHAGWIEPHWDRLPPDRRVLAERMFRPFREQVLPRWNELPQSVIYGDANDYNVLVADDPAEPRPVVSVIDFGDMVRSATAGDLAIAIGYAILDLPDPWAGAAAVVEGYSEVRQLTDLELGSLHALVCARLVVSVANSAVQRSEAKGNEYLFVSEAPVWRLLEKLSSIHPRLATYRLRAAAGVAPCPDSARVSRWISRHKDELAPVIAIAEGILPPRVDLSIGSELLDDFRLISNEPALTARIQTLRQEIGARVAVGEYDEPRLVYTSDLFRTTGWNGPEWRTIHIGLDLFTGTGCPVRTPIAGRVKAVRNNAGPGDYGPTVIVEHRVADDDGGQLTFFTLYGHLDLDTLGSLHPGQPLAAGATVGRVGGPLVNGGWSPHLHFQLIVDLLDRQGEFPGVARPSERAVWTSLSPDPHELAGVPNTRKGVERDGAAILERRRQTLGANLSVAYRRPLHIVRGWMQRLYDAEGRGYLDAVNNVPHVGHCHPRVVEAGRRQMAILATNTRYLHDTVIRYAERLGQLLPEPLSVCWFVNSGSEANELALRLAWTHTGRRGTIVLDGAYHGNTATLVSLSPYKCNGPGGTGLAPFARALPLPDPYRGRFRGATPEAAAGYAAFADGAIGELAAAGTPVGAFLAEPILSCGGQVVPPPGYFADVYRRIRAAGGVCIADEVQVGFGRVGTHFWGFETQDVVPDIVVMGKPAGNGHPLGIVVTTPEIARSFANGMEFFSTFGGNPVSAAIGLAVLDVIFDEDLQARALATGRRLLAGMDELVARHPRAGDARGTGLFVGLELVSDKESRTPDAAAASQVANRLRDLGVLVSTDGPDHNVIKIKPPLCFGLDDCDLLLAALDQALGEDAVTGGRRAG